MLSSAGIECINTENGSGTWKLRGSESVFSCHLSVTQLSGALGVGGEKGGGRPACAIVFVLFSAQAIYNNHYSLSKHHITLCIVFFLQDA